MKKLAVRLTLGPGTSIDVGRLAEQSRRIWFEYDPSFLPLGMELSPFRLPLRPGLTEHTDRAFGQLPGLFDDSLPDGWGLLLMDRELRRRGLDPASVSVLDRLTWLGTRTMGALTYHPPDPPDPVFNIGAHNRDDHAKNFAYRLHPGATEGGPWEWSLSPAYDLTPSPGPGGEHSTTVLGEGRNPTRAHCLDLARQSGIGRPEADAVIAEVNEALARWRAWAEESGCSARATARVGADIRLL